MPDNRRISRSRLRCLARIAMGSDRDVLLLAQPDHAEQARSWADRNRTKETRCIIAVSNHADFRVTTFHRTDAGIPPKS